MATPFIDSEVAPVQYFHLQSHTPPPAEKTLLWLQGVNDAGPPLHPAIDSTSEYAEETPGKTIQMLPGDMPPERHPLSPPPPPIQQLASPRKRREDPPSDWVPPSYLAPRASGESKPPQSESRIGLDLEYAVFGDHGAGSEASYQRTLQQAAGGYPPPENENENDDLGDDLYDDEDADSNEQERPASMMSPAGHTVPIEDAHARSPRYLSQSTGPSFGNINRPGSYAPQIQESPGAVHIQIQPPTDPAHSRGHTRSGPQSEATLDPVAEITSEVKNLWSPGPGSALPPIKTQGTGTSAKWKGAPDSAGTETSFKPAGPAGSVHASAVPIPPSAPMSAQVTGSRVVPQSTGMTGKQSTARGQAPVTAQMTGMTGKQSTTRGCAADDGPVWKDWDDEAGRCAACAETCWVGCWRSVDCWEGEESAWEGVCVWVGCGDWPVCGVSVVWGCDDGGYWGGGWGKLFGRWEGGRIYSRIRGRGWALSGCLSWWRWE
ncbi:hypothetical protein BDV93DRAFT_364254 [Ceratobasidium sp. AG-I]|nr:hypothetical protein BDV93DRAFT_364254 [Ceratobasidium sp. AG-I]